MISLNTVGCNSISVRRIPGDSSWKTPRTFPVRKRAKVSSSSQPTASKSIRTPLGSRSRRASAITDRVLSPRKSNLTKPALSIHSIVYWVTGMNDLGSRYKGTLARNGPSPITIPAACVDACRGRPSTLAARPKRRAVRGSSSARRCSWGTSLRWSLMRLLPPLPGSRGTSFASRSTSGKDRPSTRPISRRAARVCSEPKVLICATRSSP